MVRWIVPDPGTGPLTTHATPHGTAVLIPPRGTITVSWSEIDTARQCAFKHDLSYIERWTESVRPDGALARGTLWHLVLEQVYRSLQATQGDKPGAKPLASSADRLKQMTKAGTAVLAQATKEANGNSAALDTVDLVSWMMAGYITKWGVPDWWVAGAEHAALVRLPTETGNPSRFALKLKIDLVVILQTAALIGTKADRKKLWVVDFKCLAADTPVPTWRSPQTLAGDLHTGDLVLGSDGTWIRVDAVRETRQPSYRIRLHNGKTITASADHRWPVERAIHAGRYRREEVTTQDLIAGKHRLLAAPETPRPAERLPIDPYVLGALLGDGGFTRADSGYVTFTKAEPTVVNRVLARMPVDTGVVLESNGDHASAYRLYGELVDSIKWLGLAGTPGYDKFIPAQYLAGSTEQRWELLAGLLDTDGTCRKGVPIYQTGSIRLAQDVAALIESLGGAATIWLHESPPYQHGIGAPCWTVKARFPRSAANPFRHPAKAAGFRPSYTTQNERLTVESVEPVGEVDCVDVSVSAPDQLFVASGVLTHNSGKDLPREKDFDLMDQFSLYTWALQKVGKKVFGQLYDAARTQRNKGDSDGTAPQPLDKRFSRTLMYRTDVELERVAVEAYQSMKARYRQQVECDRLGVDPPRTTDPDRCGWRCSFTEACLHGRRGGDTRDFLSSAGLEQRFERH